jgi:glycerol kinase
MLIASIDQGTTSTKCLLVDEAGNTTNVGAIRHRQILPRDGWVEHDAAELLANVRELLARAVDAGAEALALANQGETVVAWDLRDGQPICNAIVWQDQRTASSVDALRKTGLEAEVKDRAGLPLDPYFSASKLRWILDAVPAANELARSGHLGLATSDAYFLQQLTGKYVTEATTASRTSLMNLISCTWDARLGDIFGVPLEMLPEINNGEGAFGEATVNGRSVPILASVVDQVAALYGHGCRRKGDAKVTFGTGAFALVVAGHGRPVLPNGILPTVGWGAAERRVYAADGGVYTAGAAVEWLRRIGLLADVADLEQLTGPPAIAGGLAFVPALAGLGCPHWDRSAAGLWIGMDSATGRDDLVKAVLEGVALRTAEVLDAFGPVLSSGGVLSVDGGLTGSPYFLKFFTDVAERCVVDAGERELTALGAALLARAAATGADPELLVDPSGGELPVVEPSATRADVMAWKARFSGALERASGWRSPAVSS